MIGYVKGILTYVLLDSCLVDVQGLGYRVYVPNSTREKLTVGEEVLLFTYLHVREDALILYGFSSQEEYDVFILLIGISGIGPKVAVGILSAVPPKGFRLAVQQKNIAVLTKLPGIGKKTAERILLELQDKVGTLDFGEIGQATVASDGLQPQGLVSEVLAALQGLGYSTPEVMPIIEQEQGQYTTVTTLLRAVLHALGTRR